MRSMDWLFLYTLTDVYKNALPFQTCTGDKRSRWEAKSSKEAISTNNTAKLWLAHLNSNWHSLIYLKLNIYTKAMICCKISKLIWPAACWLTNSSLGAKNKCQVKSSRSFWPYTHTKHTETKQRASRRRRNTTGQGKTTFDAIDYCYCFDEFLHLCNVLPLSSCFKNGSLYFSFFIIVTTTLLILIISR